MTNSIAAVQAVGVLTLELRHGAIYPKAPADVSKTLRTVLHVSVHVAASQQQIMCIQQQAGHMQVVHLSLQVFHLTVASFHVKCPGGVAEHAEHVCNNGRWKAMCTRWMHDRMYFCSTYMPAVQCGACCPL